MGTLKLPCVCGCVFICVQGLISSSQKNLSMGPNDFVHQQAALHNTLGLQSVCTVSSVAAWAPFKLSHTHTQQHTRTLTGLNWPVGHASLLCDCVIFAQSKHFQVPAGLQLSDQLRLVSLLRPLLSGCGVALDILGVAPEGSRPAERGHRLSAVHVVRRVSTAGPPDAPSAAPGG